MKRVFQRKRPCSEQRGRLSLNHIIQWSIFWGGIARQTKEADLNSCTRAAFLLGHKVRLCALACERCPASARAPTDGERVSHGGRRLHTGSPGDAGRTLAGGPVVCRRHAVGRGGGLGRGRVSFGGRGGALGRVGGLRLGGGFFVLVLRIELRVPLHALLHVTEVVDALGALQLLLAVVEAGKGVFELRAAGAAGHAAEARAVPVDVPVGQDQTWRQRGSRQNASTKGGAHAHGDQRIPTTLNKMSMTKRVVKSRCMRHKYVTSLIKSTHIYINVSFN